MHPGRKYRIETPGSLHEFPLTGQYDEMMVKHAKGTHEPRKRLSALERRRDIIKHARAQFVVNGYPAARIKDIAKAAGVNESLLYQHFVSKQELFDVAVLGPLDSAIAELLERSKVPPETIEPSAQHMKDRTASFVVDLLEAMEEIGPLLGVALYGGSDSPLEVYAERIEPYLQAITEAVEISTGWWDHRPFHPGIPARMAFGTVLMIALSKQAAGWDLDYDEVASQIGSIIVDGLRNPATGTSEKPKPDIS